MIGTVSSPYQPNASIDRVREAMGGLPVNTVFRLRAFVLTLSLAPPLLLALAGCGSNERVTDGAAPDAAVKKSEAHYNAEIARFKAEAAAKKPK
jgi:hypothetical protein